MTTATNPTEPIGDMLSALLARNWWAVALRGVAAILFGLIALLAPGATMLSLVLLFAALMLVDGVMNLVSGLRSARRHERWGVLILQGVVSLIAAVIAVLLPGLTVLAFVYVVAAWALVSGVFAVIAAVRLRGDHGRWWMGFSGVLSVFTGIVLAIAPLIGAVVLTWWIGAYAIVFGGTLLVLAFRLRSHRTEVSRRRTPHPA
jgi:uncharacterized membrane protein HdeD (DUF308 family)